MKARSFQEHKARKEAGNRQLLHLVNPATNPKWAPSPDPVEPFTDKEKSKRLWNGVAFVFAIFFPPVAFVWFMRWLLGHPQNR